MNVRIRKCRFPSVEVISTYTRIKFGSHLLQFYAKYNLFTNKLPQLEADTWMDKRT